MEKESLDKKFQKEGKKVLGEIQEIISEKSEEYQQKQRDSKECSIPNR